MTQKPTQTGTRRAELAAMTWSNYQVAIEQECRHGKGNIAVDAAAGSGKSTTIEWLCLSGAVSGRVLVCAFNKHIANPLGDLLGDTAEVRTINSHGNGTTKSAANQKGWGYVNSGKYRGYINEDLRSSARGYGTLADALSEHWPIQSATRVVDLARTTLLARVSSDRRVTLSQSDFYHILTNWDIDVPSEVESWVYGAVTRALQRGLDEWRTTIDFTDQNWLPVVLNLQPRTYDWVLVDEAQDLNRMQLEYVLKCLGSKGRLLAVGDPRQAMYGFSGAMHDSFDQIVRTSNAKVLPLSVCYRCPSSHLDMAREIVPTIENAPNAIQGEVRSIGASDLPSQVEDGDLILCRVNAPLISTAYTLLAQGIAARIRGGDLGKSLKADIKKIAKLPNYTFARFDESLMEFTRRECDAIMRRNGNNDEDPAIMRRRDRSQCLLFIWANNPDCSSGDCLASAIDELFDESNASVWLSSVHKAKGDQARRVFIYNPDIMPHPMAQYGPAWQMTQEWNIRYVALTRAKETIIFVNPDA